MDNLTPKISIVIVTWNVRDALQKCLVSLEKYADAPHELFVIDNGSEDDTKEFLRDYKLQNPFLLRYEVIYNDRDLGFSTAANMGMKRAQGDYILLLNPDIQILSPSFLKILKTTNQYQDLGVLGFKILKPDGRVQQSIAYLPTLGRQLASRLRFFKPKFNYDKSAEVEQINASAALIPKKVLDAIGLWDEGFFLWFEENDFCFRARRAGYKIYYNPEISFMHESQAGISKMPFWERQIIWQRSMFRYFKKHHGLVQAIAMTALDPACAALGTVLRKARKLKV